MVQTPSVPFFRHWLHSQFERRKQKNPRYSLRAFARFLEIDPTALSRILSGKQDLSIRLCERILLRIKPSDAEARLFLASVVDRRRERTSQILSRVIALPAEVPPLESTDSSGDLPEGELLFVLDRGGRMLFVNDAAARVARMERSEVVGKTVRELHLPQTLLTAIEAHREAAFTQGTGFRERIPLITVRGSVTFEHVCSPVVVEGPEGVPQVQALISSLRKVPQADATVDLSDRLAPAGGISGRPLRDAQTIESVVAR